MIAFGHSSTGVLVGAGVVLLASSNQTSTPLLIFIGFVCGIISHYVCDFIPHGHYRFGVKYINLRSLIIFTLDFFVAAVILILLAESSVGIGLELVILLSCILGAQAPDLFEAAVDLKLVPNMSWAKAHRHFHYTILHWHNEASSDLPGHGRPLRLLDLWQVAVFVIAVWVCLHFPKL